MFNEHFNGTKINNNLCVLYIRFVDGKPKQKKKKTETLCMKICWQAQATHTIITQREGFELEIIQIILKIKPNDTSIKTNIIV